MFTVKSSEGRGTMVRITDIDPQGRAAKAGVLSGDTLVSINGNEICDVLDYRFYLAESHIPCRSCVATAPIPWRSVRVFTTTSALILKRP